MAKAQLSRAPAVSYCEFQLDILTKLAEHIVHFMGRGAERPQCGMKRGGSGLSKRALQATVQQRDYCEADRPKGDRWFEFNCHHYSVTLVNQGLCFSLLGITAEGCTFFRVQLCDVNGSGRHSVHMVVWLSFRKIGVARLLEFACVVVGMDI